MGVRGFESDIVQNWPEGVVTSVLADRLPNGAVAASKNSQFYNVGPGAAIFGTRLGCELQNQTSFGAPIVSQYFLNRDSAGTDYHLGVDTSNNLKKLVSGTVSTIGAFVTSTANQFSWQTNQEWAYMVNGVDAKKTNGTLIYGFGIQQPVTGAWSISATGSGGVLPADTYDIAISYVNSALNHEGPVADFKSVAITAGQKLAVALPSGVTIADAQVDYIKIYIRPQSTSTELFLVVAGADVAITGTTGWPVGTSPITLNCSAAQLVAFEILAPQPNDNFPPPSATKFVQNHKFRMFAATATDVYWSADTNPEAFNLLDDHIKVGEGDGDNITGLAVIGEILVVFKSNAVYMLEGDTPDSWQIKLVDKTVGCTSYNSIGYFNNELWWMSLRGPHKWGGLGNNIDDIATELIGPNFDADHINPADLANAIIIGHPVQNYVAWAVTPSGQSRNTTIIPFNYKLNRWMASEWNMVDVRSCANVQDSTGRYWPMIGDYDGFVYQVGKSTADGLPTGAGTLGLVTAATSTTLSDSLSTWTTNSLKGKYVYAWSDGNKLHVVQRRRITANTATQLTVTPAWTTTPGNAFHYALGGILFDWRTGFRNGGVEFFKKRIEFAFFELGTSFEGTDCEIAVYTDLNIADPVFTRTISLGDGAVYGVAVYGTDLYATSGANYHRVPVRTVGHSWQLQVLHMSSGEQAYVYRTGVQWLSKTKKVGVSRAT